MDELTKLKVFAQDGGTLAFTDRTKEAWDYSRDNFTWPATAANYYLYLSRYKPFGAIYAELSVPNPSSAFQNSAQYWNGTAWVTLALVVDDTVGFSRSGFLKWTKPSDWAATTVNGVTEYFIRLSISGASNVGIAGINLVFSDDNDLKHRRFDIMDFLPQDQAGNTAVSFILAHVSAREEILQRLNRDGRIKRNSTSGKLLDVDQWDLHNPDQLRTASAYLALSYIFEALRDVKDDIYGKRAASYYDDYEKAMEVFLLSLDTDDTGVETLDETNSNGFEIILRR